MLYIGNCEKIVKYYSYDTSNFLKKNIINNNNKNLINSFSISKINNTSLSYINHLKSFQKLLKKFLSQIKLPYVSIGVWNSLKSNSLVNYQRTKKKYLYLKML